jgi:hypothetical protein
MSARTFTSADGLVWRVEVRQPGASNAMIVFRHPDGATSRLDRYNWYNSTAPESKNVTARLDPDAVLQVLTDAELALLFRRSMLISAADNPLSLPVTQFGV